MLEFKKFYKNKKEIIKMQDENLKPADVAPSAAVVEQAGETAVGQFVQTDAANNPNQVASPYASLTSADKPDAFDKNQHDNLNQLPDVDLSNLKSSSDGSSGFDGGPTPVPTMPPSQNALELPKPEPPVVIQEKTVMSPQPGIAAPVEQPYQAQVR